MQQRRRRKLTPQQRKRLRRKRWLKKNAVYFAILGVLLVIAIALLTLTGGKPAKDKTGSNTIAALPADSSGPDESAEDSEGADPAGEGEAVPAEGDDSVTETAAPVATEEPVDLGPFVFDTAYEAALNGKITGDPITPNYDGIDPSYANRWPDTKEGWMPLLYNARNTTEPIIAITVDDCFQADNLRQIVQCAKDNSSKLTIFPIGKNLELESVSSVIRDAWQSGMEIENHTYTHCGLYHYSDQRMCTEIWTQNLRLNEVLGVNYTEHFFRPYGGDERECQRMQACVNQYGFKAVAVWNYSGSSSNFGKLQGTLAPGNIYLFHTTDKDLGTLLQFIPYCVQAGYKLVTLNEMFGLPENETAPLTTTMQTPVPALKAFRVDPVSLKATARCRAAAAVQQQLIKLGWLDGEADGEYGNGSAKATAFFQLASGISVNGVASVDLQKLMFADDAQTGSEERKNELLQAYYSNK